MDEIYIVVIFFSECKVIRFSQTVFFASFGRNRETYVSTIIHLLLFLHEYSGGGQGALLITHEEKETCYV